MRKLVLGPIFGVLLAAGLLFEFGCAGGGGGSSPALYLALGDSIAAGEGATVPGELGYAGLYRSTFEAGQQGAIEFQSLAAPGATSSDFIGRGPDLPAIGGSFEGGRTSSYDAQSQLGQAVGALVLGGFGDWDVEVITLTIGANDLLPLTRSEPCDSAPASLACRSVTAEALGAFAGNYTFFFDALTGAMEQDPGAELVLVTTYYNPYDGTGHRLEGPMDGVLLGSDGVVDCEANAADPGTTGLNDLIVCIGASFGAKPVDLYPLFDGKALSLTHIGEGDIHPNDQGHQVIADAVTRAYNNQ